MGWSKMVDMELDDEDVHDTVAPYLGDKAAGPQYPYGLRICLTDKELKKLGIDVPENVGDVIDIRAFACVKNISRNQNEGGDECVRIELQIEKMSVESEMQETR